MSLTPRFKYLRSVKQARRAWRITMTKSGKCSDLGNQMQICPPDSFGAGPQTKQSRREQRAPLLRRNCLGTHLTAVHGEILRLLDTSLVILYFEVCLVHHTTVRRDRSAMGPSFSALTNSNRRLSRYIPGSCEVSGTASDERDVEHATGQVAFPLQEGPMHDRNHPER